jgi:hypothetical protein
MVIDLPLPTPDLLMEPELQWLLVLELAWGACVLMYMHIQDARA